MPVKLRNKPLPTKHLILTTSWDYAYVGRYTNKVLEPMPDLSNSESSNDLDDDGLDLSLD